MLRFGWLEYFLHWIILLLFTEVEVVFLALLQIEISTPISPLSSCETLIILYMICWLVYLHLLINLILQQVLLFIIIFSRIIVCGRTRAFLPPASARVSNCESPLFSISLTVNCLVFNVLLISNIIYKIYGLPHHICHTICCILL